MKLAHELIKNGMVAHEMFMDAISDLIEKNSLKKIIETGSYLGQGTTKAIDRVLRGDEVVYSIEVNPINYARSKANNKGSRIKFLNGLSVDKADRPISISFDVPDHVVVDFTDHNREVKYQEEVNYNVSDNMLDYALSQMDYKPDLVILDSAGHMGMIEFKYLMDRVKGDFYLALDDTDHVKHYATLEYLIDSGYNVIFHTHEGFGSAIIKIDGVTDASV